MALSTSQTVRMARSAVFVDVTIPHDNLVKAEKEKLSKYLDLDHEIIAMWDVNASMIIVVVVLVNGLTVKNLDQHLKRLSLSCCIKKWIQKAVLLETVHIVWRFLFLEP